MIKNKTQIETVISEKTYNFLCDQDSTLDSVRSALHNFLGMVDQIEERIKKAQEEAAKAAELPVEEKVEPITTPRDNE